MVFFEILNADAYQYFPSMPEHSVDVILTDPPYNLRPYSTGNIKPSWRKEFNNDVAEWDGEFDPADIVENFIRVTKPHGNIFAFTSYNMLGRWHEVFDPRFDTFQFIVWHKTNPPPKIRRAGFLNSCELIVCVWNGGHTWNFTNQKDMHNFIEAPICMGKERLRDPFHPTQKPLVILRRLIEISSNPGDIILDPFMGVGSTGEAALSLGRSFIGVEIDPVYFEAAKDRFFNSFRIKEEIVDKSPRLKASIIPPEKLPFSTVNKPVKTAKSSSTGQKVPTTPQELFP